MVVLVTSITCMTRTHAVGTVVTRVTEPLVLVTVRFVEKVLREVEMTLPLREPRSLLKVSPLVVGVGVVTVVDGDGVLRLVMLLVPPLLLVPLPLLLPPLVLLLP